MKEAAQSVEEVAAVAPAAATVAAVAPAAATVAAVAPRTALALLGRRGDGATLARSALALQGTAGNRAVSRRVLARKKKKVYSEPPGLVSPSFCGATAVKINPVLAARLVDAENSLKTVWASLPAEEKWDHETGAPTTDMNKWVGVKSIGGYKPGSFHSSGSAIDVDANFGPYMATRTPDGKGGYTYGGEEAGSHLLAERKRALEVNDRAVQWIGVQSAADLSARKTGESTADVYDRLMVASSSLQAWMIFAIRYTVKDDPKGKLVPAMITRAPIKNAWDATKVSDADLIAKIPETERMPKDESVKWIQDVLDADWFKQLHATTAWTLNAEQTYFQILRDYETVRIPWVSGQPSALPAVTRNPIHGFIHHKRELVIALCDVGKLRWGACDFGAGSSGDTHHFDLGMHPAGHQPVYEEVEVPDK